MLPKLHAKGVSASGGKTIQWILIVSGLTLLTAIGGFSIGYFYSKYYPVEESETEGETQALDCDTIMVKDDWQLYANEEGFGYTIKYPSDWQYSEDLMKGHSYWNTAFGPKGDISATAAILIGETNRNLENFQSFITHGLTPPSILGINEEVIVDGDKTTKYTLHTKGLEEFKYIQYFLPYSYINVNRIFQGNTEESKRHENCEAEVFYSMLSTYKFGQEYEHEDCTMTFRYPVSWEVEMEEYYQTPTGITAKVPTIVLHEFGETDSNESIGINMRQSDCGYVISPETEEFTINGNTVKTYENETQGAFCMEAETPANCNGEDTTFHWTTYSTNEETQNIFKQILETYE